MPEALEFRTKSEIALKLLLRLRRDGPHYSPLVFDVAYGLYPDC